MQPHGRATTSYRAALLKYGAVPAIILTWLVPVPAEGARLIWRGGDTNLTLSIAQRCTLQVTFTPDEMRNLREWRLLWVSDGPAIAPVGTPGSGEPGALEACAVRLDGEGTRGAHVDTAYYCAPTWAGAADRPVSVPIDVRSTRPVRIGVLPILDNGGVATPDLAGLGEATINGGSKSTYAPLMVGASFTNLADATLYHIAGAFLGDVQAARIFQPQVGTIFPIQVKAKGPDSLELRGPLLEDVQTGLIEVGNSLGQWTALPIEWAAAGLRRVNSPRVLVRLERAALRLDPGGGSTGPGPALSDSIAVAGATSLRPLFPAGLAARRKIVQTNSLGEPISLDPIDDWFVATLDGASDVASVVDRIRAIPGVRQAEEERWAFAAHLAPNDSLFGQQWGLSNPGTSVCGYQAIYTASIFANQAWDKTTGNPNVRLAILDTGINPYHEDLGSGRVQLGPNFVNGGLDGGLAFDDNGHGTSVAGIAAAVGNNGTGVAGVAWQVQPWAVRVLNSNAGGVSGDLALGVAWADSLGIPILNMSLGFAEGSAELGPGGHALLATLTLNALRSGRFLVASSGNANEALGTFSPCPADLSRRVYAVGAFLPNGLRWADHGQLGLTPCDNFTPCFMSNYGGFLDALAPGGRLITTTGLGQSEYVNLSNCVTGDRNTMGYSGTSAAAPVVSGIAALLLARRPELIGEDIAQVLNITETGPNPPGNWVPEYGWGRVNALTALNFVGPSKVLAHWGAGPGPYSIGPLQVVDSSNITSRLFLDVPGMPANYTTSCMRYRLRATLTWPFPFASDVRGWTRTSGTSAWKDFGPYGYNEEVDTATFVPGTFGTTGATVEAFVFRVRDASDPSKTLGWFPTDPTQAHVAFTVIGTPAGTAGVTAGSVTARLTVTTSPNPSRAAVRMGVEVPVKGHVRMTILDVAGRQLATLVEGELGEGHHEFLWDGTADHGGRYPAGVYFCRVDCRGQASFTRFVRLSSH